jgi:hypothetical protein
MNIQLFSIKLKKRVKEYTAESQLSDLNGTKGQSDNKKCQIIQNTNEEDEGKYQLNLRYY